MVSAIVLAAGLSTRMGEHKMLTKLGDGQGLLQRVVASVSTASFDEVILVTGRDASAIREELRDFEINTVHNSKYKDGLSSSIARGVQAARKDALGFAICLGDMPMIESAEYNQLIEEFRQLRENDEKTILIPSFAGRRGNPVLFSSKHSKDILSNEYPDGCKPIVKNNSCHISELEMETGHVLVDVDTPADLGRLEE